MKWEQIADVVRRSCDAQGDERHVLLVLPQASYHVKSILTDREHMADDMLGFEVWADDPSVSTRTPAVQVLFVRPDGVRQILLEGLPPVSPGA